MRIGRGHRVSALGTEHTAVVAMAVRIAAPVISGDFGGLEGHAMGRPEFGAADTSKLTAKRMGLIYDYYNRLLGPFPRGRDVSSPVKYCPRLPILSKAGAMNYKHPTE